ncbi:hypothetical protein JX265_010406 [Neoarthrinium moseri]|uniref:Rhodopsin domain-containing protein n=1 Tax=Neoarthrinium moseri TaxID=1658444 RepID=A0A9P9WEC4_9PEZI|nr:uncharacterized protein JN550_012484 [Neoarthrinium moseri]KAI1858734.1 hypothetical protein JN550_012484 [Neoarthrinium moseri]KAI1859403.1 hypothetical protein JX265_010406 [Neoarthrinium moseri]
MIWLGGLVVQFPLTTVKIALLLFCKRVFQTPVFKKCAWTAIGVVSIWGVLFFLLVLVQIEAISLSDMFKSKLRFDSTAMGIAQVGTSIALDFVVLCFPLPVISRLQMGRNRKWAVALIFWLGIFCVLAAIVRLVLLEKSLGKVDVDFKLVYLQDEIFIFKVIEPNASIIAALSLTNPSSIFMHLIKQSYIHETNRQSFDIEK